MDKGTEIKALQNALERERTARKQAEQLLEQKSRELYRTNLKLQELNESLSTKAARNAAERRLTAAQLETLIALLPFGVLVEDAERRVVLVNQPFCSMFQLEEGPDRMRGQLWSDSETKASQLFEVVNYSARVREVLDRGLPVVAEPLPLRAGGTFERDFVPIGSSQERAGALWLFRDVTDAKEQLIEVLRARQAAEQANDARAQFLATVSHEMRTPLSVVTGLAGLLQEEELNPKQQEMCQKIAYNADSLLHLIEDLLDTARIDSGKIALQETVFSVRKVVEDVVAQYRPQTAKQNVELTLEVAPKVPVYAFGDGLRLAQILRNLIGNAVKFTPSGTIGVTVRSSAHGICFAVADSGKGIPRDRLAEIFERFEQTADLALSRKGLGLGLSICKSLAEAMGGTIDVESELGVGSRFGVQLPLKPADKPEIKSGRSSRGRFQGRVLLVEDDEDNRYLIERRLELFGLTTSTATNGRDGARAAADTPFNLILTDLSMDGGDGFELLQSVRAHPRDKHRPVPVVALSAHKQGEYHDLFLAMGGNHFLAKPVDLTQLERVLALYLEVRKNVLLVDDSEDHCLLMKRYLQTSDCSVAVSANDALAQLATKDFDCILMDMQLPDLQGDELALRLREAGFVRRIVALTGETDPTIHERLRTSGCDAVLTKPVTKQSVVSEVSA